MFGGNSNPSATRTAENEAKSLPDDLKPTSSTDDGGGTPGNPSPSDSNTALVESSGASPTAPTQIKSTDAAASGEKRSGNGSPPSSSSNSNDKKRRSSGVGTQARNLLASAKNTLSIGSGRNNNADSPSSLQRLGKSDPALAVPQGQHNNSAGQSLPGPRSTFRVGVWEDRNKKCRRTMEDTHAFLYNFLPTPAPAIDGALSASSKEKPPKPDDGDAPPPKQSHEMVETDNGYFAIFDGHAGNFAADWCGKKLHLILEDVIRKNPNTPIPELLDQAFTSVDTQLEKLPTKSSGCTAAIAVLRWEDRVPSERSATGSQAIAPAAAKAAARASTSVDDVTPKNTDELAGNGDPVTPQPILSPAEATQSRLKNVATRQRVLYTANVGDARIILCRAGKALRLSYDHKGSDENEGKRITNAGGLILNNRVNGVLAVTRALGDTYMKDLVTGHPYTTETVIQPDSDEFIIIACDGLWDVCSDQEAVDLVRNIADPFAASKLLVDHALNRFSTDNLSCLIVRFDRAAVLDNQTIHPIGVEGDAGIIEKTTEADKIVSDTKAKIDKGTVQAVGVSASGNAAPGRDEIEQNQALDQSKS